MRGRIQQQRLQSTRLKAGTPAQFTDCNRKEASRYGSPRYLMRGFRRERPRKDREVEEIGQFDK